MTTTTDAPPADEDGTLTLVQVRDELDSIKREHLRDQERDLSHLSELQVRALARHDAALCDRIAALDNMIGTLSPDLRLVSGDMNA